MLDYHTNEVNGARGLSTCRGYEVTTCYHTIYAAIYQPQPHPSPSPTLALATLPYPSPSPALAPPPYLAALELPAGLSNSLDGMVKLYLAWQTVDHLIECLGHSLGCLGKTQLLVGNVGILHCCLGLGYEGNTLVHDLWRGRGTVTTPTA